jgi:SAM-dependent methyltransferase
MKLHLGCGKNRLEGWSNHNRDVDIRLPLPFESLSAEFVFAEHLIEHVPFLAGVAFLEEVWRVLRPNGVLRLSFPDPLRVAELASDDLEIYRSMVHGQRGDSKAMRGRELSRAELVRAVLVSWGHQSAWTYDLAFAVLVASRFDTVNPCKYANSAWPELHGIDGHHREVGPAALLETSVVEAVKR